MPFPVSWLIMNPVHQWNRTEQKGTLLYASARAESSSLHLGDFDGDTKVDEAKPVHPSKEEHTPPKHCMFRRSPGSVRSYKRATPLQAGSWKGKYVAV